MGDMLAAFYTAFWVFGFLLLFMRRRRRRRYQTWWTKGGGKEEMDMIHALRHGKAKVIF